MYPAKEPLRISTWRPATEQAPYSALASTLQLGDLSPFPPVVTDPLGLHLTQIRQPLALG
jgi:hypothetical protein